jgi:hypothetical protein
MTTRQELVFALAVVFTSMGASYPTANFMVEAPTPQIAQRVGQMAEYYRKEKAIEWIGHEMPPWSERCPLHVKITLGGAGGATSFNFMNGQVWQTMQIEGSLDRLLASVLPHEVTHTVFAYYFRCPVPRWADEGGAVLSEDDLERSRHDMMVRQILNSGHAIPLRRLFALRDYPREVGALYAEGYSVSNFLVASSNRPVFLSFVAHGMQYGWDSAAQSHYHLQSVEQLEEAWLNYLRNTKRQQTTQLAANTGSPADSSKRVVVRLTAPPAQPFQELRPPIIRGQSPESEVNGGRPDQPSRPPVTRPGYLPDINPRSELRDPRGVEPTYPSSELQGVTHPGSPQAPHDGRQIPGVRLGAPQWDAVAPAHTSWPGSPAGYPY